MIVFVSYSSKNYDLARALAVQIGVYGHDVQFEQKAVGGQVGWHEVFESIKACDLFILAVTPRSVDSYSCQLEYAYANALGKRILPVAIEEMDEVLLRQHFGNSYVHWRLSPDQHSGLEHALEEIQVAEPPPPPAIPPMRPDWVNSMIILRDSVIALPQGPRAQFSILDNLIEFLERDDSLPDALAIMGVMQANPQLSPQVATELTSTLQNLEQNRAKQRAPKRGRRLLRDLGLIVGGAVLILVVARGIAFFNRPGATAGTPTPATTEEAIDVAALNGLDVTSEVTDEVPLATLAPPTVDLTLAQLNIEIEGTVTAAISTAIAVASYTLTPIPSATLTPPPQATDAPTNTLDAAGTRNAVNLQNTATAAVGTALAVAAYTPTPAATNTVPPTLSPIPSATLPPATTVAPTVALTATLAVTVAPSLSFEQQLTARATSNALVYVGMQVEDTDQGVRITAVGNSARQAGVRVGDYVTAVDVEAFNDRAGFLQIMNGRRAFTQVTFRLVRGNSTIYIRVPLALLDFGSPSAAGAGS